MGAAASAIDGNTSMSLDKCKELAGDLWSEELEAKFNAKWEEKENITLNDIKGIMPSRFIEANEQIDEEKVKAVTLEAGQEWNEQLQGVFDLHKAAEGATIEFSAWKGLVPMIFETAEEKKVRMAAEFKAMLEKRAEGNIIVNYQMYNEEFPISKNSITAARIDEDYGLTDVMPGCRIRLSTLDSKRRTLYQNEYPDAGEAPWVKEEPEGTFRELLAGATYYCIVIEDAAQYKKDMAEMQKRLEGVSKDTEQKERQEGCSCLYGNPCQDPYVCLDWDNRWAVALANGMTQAEIKRAGIIG